MAPPQLSLVSSAITLLCSPFLLSLIHSKHITPGRNVLSCENLESCYLSGPQFPLV